MKLTNQEIQFLIDICQNKRTNRYSKDIITENTITHDVDVYFLIGKLEEQLLKQ